ncbi:MAG TPA: hypothetical protein VF070_48885 [Streptosporangiaceae bacterium]
MQDYLIGELSAWLERFESASAGTAVGLTWLRPRVETRPAAELRAEAAQVLALVGRLCRDSLSRGDTVMFDRQAVISAGLRLFGICPGLLDGE